MKILCLSDTHIGSGYEHRRDALADTAEMFDQVSELVKNRGVDLVLHAGDVFHRAKPTPPELHVFKGFLDHLRALEVPLLAISGNGLHEAAPGQKSALELFAGSGVYVSRIPRVFPIGDISVCTLPAVSPSYLTAYTDDQAAAADKAIDLLISTARTLYAEAPADRPRVLLAHQMVSGASLPTGLPVDAIGSTVLPLWLLEEIGFDAIILGDIHKAQVLESRPFASKTPTWYCGSPLCQDFGEESIDHGVWIWEPGDAPEFVKLSGRRFVTIYFDLAVAAENGYRGDETGLIAAVINERTPLSDAVVRVRYRASEEQHRRVDYRALTQLLDNAGVHRLFGGISWEPVRESRARAAALDESLDPLSAVDLWLASQSLNGPDGEALKALLGGWLETIDV